MLTAFRALRVAVLGGDSSFLALWRGRSLADKTRMDC